MMVSIKSQILRTHDILPLSTVFVYKVRMARTMLWFILIHSGFCKKIIFGLLILKKNHSSHKIVAPISIKLQTLQTFFYQTIFGGDPEVEWSYHCLMVQNYLYVSHRFLHFLAKIKKFATRLQMFLPQNARTPAAGHDVHCTSPTQNVTSPSNVTFYLLLVVTLSRRARLPLKRVPPLRISRLHKRRLVMDLIAIAPIKVTQCYKGATIL